MTTQKMIMVGDPVYVLPLGRVGEVTRIDREQGVIVVRHREHMPIGLAQSWHYQPGVLLPLDRHPIGKWFWWGPPQRVQAS